MVESRKIFEYLFVFVMVSKIVLLRLGLVCFHHLLNGSSWFSELYVVDSLMVFVVSSLIILAHQIQSYSIADERFLLDLAKVNFHYEWTFQHRSIEEKVEVDPFSLH